MSLITHRCTVCKHPDIRRDHDFHKGVRHEMCDCGCRCTPGPPTIIPSFDNAGQRVEAIGEPGTKADKYDLCGCDDCKTIHRAATTGRVSHDAVRAWCTANTVCCPAEGPVPRHVIEEYKAAHGFQARPEPTDPPPVPAEPPSTAVPSTRQVRKWAAEHDIPCPPRGRIPAAVREAYDAAHTT